MQFNYKKGILGGTFDHFHLGHQQLIDSAFAAAEQVTIGVTMPAMYQHKLLAAFIETYETRSTKLTQYLKAKNYFDRSTIIPIEDIYGTTLEEKDIEAIFVTEENLPNVAKINTKREKIGFPAIKVILVPYVQARDKENITSERIRKGEIDQEGVVYKELFKQTLVLPEDLRPELQNPLGTLVSTTQEVLNLLNEKAIVITVGDIITSKLKAAGFEPAISIIDFKTRRHEIDHKSFDNATAAKNHPGTIDNKAIEIFIAALNNYLKTNTPQIIVVEGEEDLLALPAILLAPLEAIVLYGQFDQGVVVNKVTEELKKKLTQLIYRFN